MVRSKEDIMTNLKTVIGDNVDDSVLSLLEDINDTITGDGEDWKGKFESSNTEWEQKYKDLDDTWRQKYRDRFYGSVDDNDGDFNPANDKGQNKITTFEGLFKEV